MNPAEDPTRAAASGALLVLFSSEEALRESLFALLRGSNQAFQELPATVPGVLRMTLPDLQTVAGSRALQARLQELAGRAGADLCLLDASEWRPRRRLCAFDMDSTLIDCEVIDELAKRAGVGDEVAAVTARAMRGELDFRASFRERMAKLRGLPAQQLDELRDELPLMPGVERLMARLRALGHETVILSGGFDFFARHLQQHLSMDEVHANRLQIIDHELSGEVEGEIVDAARKVLLLREVAARRGFAMADTVAVGDGANDLAMLATAGLGVAFHAKPLVRERADHAINFADLDGLLQLLDVPGAENQL